ncbi:MAG: membrane permeability protein SanA [Leptospira sp.]|nr:membrane permeability protein SanA [Leptospira sp.]NCS92851.1 membrane permeability protein SanA [Leptospira sp.]
MRFLVNNKIYVLAFLAFLFMSGGVALSIDKNMVDEYQASDPSKNFRTVPVATVAIIPGAAVYGLTPSPILIDRLRCGLYLYKYGKVKKILLSGDNGTAYYNELKPMLQFMLSNGVKKEDVFVDHAGFRTLDTMVRARAVYQIQDAIFVSQKFHQARAHFIAKKVGIELASYESDMRIYRGSRYYKFREFFARILAWVDMNLFHTAPKYLGDPFPIQGSGIETWKGSIL